MGKIRFPFENLVRVGQTPKDLSMRDQYAFSMLEKIYLDFSADKITAKEAGKKKRELWEKWNSEIEQEKRLKSMEERYVRIIKETESLRNEIMRETKNPKTVELAIQLCKTIDGLK